MPCRQSRDKDGTTYHIAEDRTGKTPGGHQVPGCAAVDVWWARRFKDKRDETLFIRQNGDEKADVIELTPGQVYDLIHALGWAILKP